MDGEEVAGLVRLAPQVMAPAAALLYSASRSGGPGGQHVNKTESRIELRVVLADLHGLSPSALTRLRALAGARLTGDDALVLCCDETRSQRRNRELVLERLRDLVREALIVPRPRRPTRPGRGAIERRLRDKAARSERKRDRRGGE